MIVLRQFIVFFMFSAFLIGCTTPLIDIDVKHSTGGGPGGGGSCHPWLLAMGLCIPTGGASLPIDGTVTEATVPGFTVEKTDGSGDLMFLPASVFEVDGDTPAVGQAVTITLSNQKIKKQ